MARYTGAECRQCRREGAKLFLKGDRCYSDKCSFSRRGYAPGQHGQGRKKVSEYGLQLREKQKARRIYGILERQFRTYFRKADRQAGVTGENLLVLLERRLDNVVYRLGMASSRNQARQVVLHGHIEVNGRRVNIPSFLVRQGDVVSVREGSRSSVLMQEAAERMNSIQPGPWLELTMPAMTGRVIRYPSREEIDTQVQEQMIVELYSR
ncbi:MAG: 30S ribosomal protein S4 [Negativicutes bacterium]|nr:30S ribosomal protein S4 [Negativicutes bacterium]